MGFEFETIEDRGLWLAVIITPPMARCCFTAKETEGVGVGAGVSTTW